MLPSALIRSTPKGLYCEAGDFYIDPTGPVHRAVITHGHGDHARPGSRSYLAASSSEHILRTRLGSVSIQFLPYGKSLQIKDTKVSLHPAGHILGSAQIRIESSHQVLVVSGDYKLEEDPTCLPFEPVPCDLFLTESTFALPIYRWPDPKSTIHAIEAWWQNNQQEGKVSLLSAYALGKAQRILAQINPQIGPIWVHPNIAILNEAYRKSGVPLPPANVFNRSCSLSELSRSLILVPPHISPARFLGTTLPVSIGFASGWMLTRETYSNRSVNAGFVLSDHADWPSLLKAIDATGAKVVYASHGYADFLVDHLRSQNRIASVI